MNDFHVFQSILLAILVGAPGCAHPLQKKLQGRWLGDGVENVEDGEIARATGWVRGTSMDFSGSSVTVSIPTEEPRSGTYRIARARGPDLTLEIRRPDGKVDTASFTLEGDHVLYWRLADDRTVTFRRER